jgi:hypothetical protein
MKTDEGSKTAKPGIHNTENGHVMGSVWDSRSWLVKKVSC